MTFTMPAASGSSSGSVTVKEARLKLMDSVLHAEANEFTTTKQDRAIIAACNRFLRETHVARSTRSVALTSGTRVYDLDSSVGTGFRPDQIIGMPHIAATDWRPLQVVDYEVIRREFDTSAATGRPEMVGFNGDQMTVFPTPDANYTVTFQTWDVLDQTNWTIGGVDSSTLAVTLNIPNRWADDVIWWGARAYLLMGAPGHPDAGAAMQHFERVIIPSAKGEGQRSGRWWPSYKGTIEQAYGPRPRL